MSNLHRTITERIVADLYDVPIMSNLARPAYVEHMIALALGDDWSLVSANWSGWDIENARGVRVEIKQSAALQPWTNNPSFKVEPNRGAFDIRPREGYWADGGSRWVQVNGRLPDIYIFSWHPILDKRRVDQRNHHQWEFYTIPEQSLPRGQKTIGLSRVRELAGNGSPFSYDDLSRRLDDAVSNLATLKAGTESR